MLYMLWWSCLCGESSCIIVPAKLVGFCHRLPDSFPKLNYNSTSQPRLLLLQLRKDTHNHQKAFTSTALRCTLP